MALVYAGDGQSGDGMEMDLFMLDHELGLHRAALLLWPLVLLGPCLFLRSTQLTVGYDGVLEIFLLTRIPPTQPSQISLRLLQEAVSLLTSRRAVLGKACGREDLSIPPEGFIGIDFKSFLPSK